MQNNIEPLIIAVILNYNSTQDCIICMEHLIKQDYPNLSIIIVDNDSEKDELISLEIYCKKNNLELICNSSNVGFAKGNNFGLRRATELGAKFALVINPDVQVKSPDYLSVLVSEMKLDPYIAISAGDMIGLEGEHQNPRTSAGYWLEVLWPITYILRRKFRINPYLGDWKSKGRTEKLSGGCLLFNTKFLEKIKYLDEGTFLYMEETILAYQTAKEKMFMFYTPEVNVLHAHKKSNGKASLFQMHELWKSQDYFFEKYKPYSGVKKLLLNISYKTYRFAMTKKLEK